MVEEDDRARANRLDEVARHYAAPRRVGRFVQWLFYGGALLSLALPHVGAFGSRLLAQTLVIAFVVVALTYFVLSQGQRYYWLPRAERQRTRALLSNGLGVSLSHDRTRLYYNNSYNPSVQRLGANVMENALFGKAVAAEMLRRARVQIGAYLILWIIAFAIRHNDLALMVWVTQFVFSAGIAARWLSLEVLHARFERCFDELHAVFCADPRAEGAHNVASILEAVVSYEAAKSAGGVLLNEEDFARINREQSQRWDRIRKDLKMDS